MAMTFGEMVVHKARLVDTVSKRIGFNLSDFDGMTVQRLQDLVNEGKEALIEAGYTDVRSVGIYETVDGHEYLDGFGYTFRNAFTYLN